MKKKLNLRNASCLLVIFGLLGVLLIPSSIFAAGGQQILTTVHCKSLEGNPIGASADRKVLFYLPPGYAENTNTRYPVIYLLHSWGSNYQFFTGRGTLKYAYFSTNVNIPQLCDSLIAQGAIKPMIAVMPDSYETKYQGCLNVNSPSIGNWEDFITKDVVAFADSAYRTIPQAASRGIFGDGTGADSAFMLAMQHPKTFGVVYGLLGDMDITYTILGDNFMINCIKSAAKNTNLNDFVQLCISFAVAYSPNADAKPYPCDFPYDASGQFVESVWQKWLLHNPTTMIPSYKDNLKQLKGISFGHGSGASNSFKSAYSTFADSLKLSSIPYVYNQFEWSTDGLYLLGYSESIAQNTLPFFSEKLAFSTVTSVSGDAEVPETFALFQNSPNPFNPSTTISFTLTKAGETTVDVFNVSGQKVDTVLDAYLGAGAHSVTWNAVDRSAGLYFYTVRSGGVSKTMKMVLVK